MRLKYKSANKDWEFHEIHPKVCNFFPITWQGIYSIIFY